MSTGESGPPPFQRRSFLLPGAQSHEAMFEPCDPFTPNTRGRSHFTGHRRGDEFHPARGGEINVKPNKREPEVDPIISDPAARFTMVLFLALFTFGAALLIRRGPSSVPDGDHWIDRVMSSIKTFYTFAAMLLIPYLVLAEGVYAERQEEQLRLRFQHGLAEGCKHAAQRFSEGSTDVWTDWTEWLKPHAWNVDQNPSLRPGPEIPGVDAVPSLQTPNSTTDRDRRPRRGRRESTSCATPTGPLLWGRSLNAPSLRPLDQHTWGRKERINDPAKPKLSGGRHDPTG